MTSGPTSTGKLPGKTSYSGIRRPKTRESGFKVAHQNASSGSFCRRCRKKIPLQKGEKVEITFTITGHSKGDLIGYGLWFWHTAGVVRSLSGGSRKRMLTKYDDDDSWNKAGSMWHAQDASPVEVILTLTAEEDASVALYDPKCGLVQHEHIDTARPNLLTNMYQFAPEGLFISKNGVVTISPNLPEKTAITYQPLILKSCNRCDRYLPVNNMPVERNHLSFSNHCVAPDRRPCRHASFARLHNKADPKEVLQLDYGYQLECRFCKKFEVNAAHNPQRSSAQMKEDSARRRNFETLIGDLYEEETPQIRYRRQNGTELADDVWKRFGGTCFNCKEKIPSQGSMALDHTRPLALLWPLDETATALCKTCNSQKRDQAPSKFYTSIQLKELAEIIGICYSDLAEPSPNEEALGLLLSRRDWFFDTFLQRKDMTKKNDGKIVGELVVKALQKVLAHSKQHQGVNLQDEYECRRQQKH